MIKTVAKITMNGRYRVTYNDAKQSNPFTVLREWYDRGWHSKKLAEYEDMMSCMYHLATEIGKR